MHKATATRSGSRRVSEWVQLIREQFHRTPNLCVTAEQASQIWGLETPEIEAMLAAFVDARMLSRTRGGAYTVRRGEAVATRNFGFPPTPAWQQRGARV